MIVLSEYQAMMLAALWIASMIASGATCYQHGNFRGWMRGFEESGEMHRETIEAMKESVLNLK